MRDGELVPVAEYTARALHADQDDKLGERYAGHLAAVVAGVRAAGGSDVQVAAGWLHDAVEDGHTTVERLAAAGFPLPVLVLVDAVSMRPGESRADYFRRIFACPGAALVKQADHDHNHGRLHLITDEDTRKRLGRKYDREAGWLADGRVS